MNTYIERVRDGSIRQVYSPDDATVFSETEANPVRAKAYELWPNCDWQLKKMSGEEWRIEGRST